MEYVKPSSNRLLAPALVIVLVAVSGGAVTTAAQDLSDLQKPKSPLVLEAQGSFYVGGSNVERTSTEFADFLGTGPGHMTISQMYVQYMIPGDKGKKVPVVMVHGSTLSGKSWETTPDGRMGWDEYFVRKGHSTFIVDQVSRARSGFDQSVYNNVRAELEPPSTQPPMNRFRDENAWTVFRFGPSFGKVFPNQRFPVEFADELAKQGIPDLNATLPDPNPSFKALSDLAIKLKGVVLMGHSQSGDFPVETALANTSGIRGLINVEGSCPAVSDEQIAKLVPIPFLLVYGDNIGSPSSQVPWQTIFDECQDFIARLNAAGGNGRTLFPPDLGIFGNSHMIMMDRNNLQIADLILKWIELTVDKKKVADKHDKKKPKDIWAKR